MTHVAKPRIKDLLVLVLFSRDILLKIIRAQGSTADGLRVSVHAHEHLPAKLVQETICMAA